MYRRIVYRLPARRRVFALVVVVVAPLVVGSVAVLVRYPVGDQALSLTALTIDGVGVVAVSLFFHERLHAALFRAFGAIPVRSRRRQIAVNAPDARLSTAQYLGVLLLPLGLIVVGCVALLYWSSTRLGACACIAVTCGLSVFDICRAIAVTRGRVGKPPWADLPEAIADWNGTPADEAATVDYMAAKKTEGLSVPAWVRSLRRATGV